MHDLVRHEHAATPTRALSAGPPEVLGARRWALAATDDGRKLASIVVLLSIVVLGAIRAFDQPWSTPLTPLLLAAPYMVAVWLGAAGARPRALGAGVEGGRERPTLELVGDAGPSFEQIAGMACAACTGKIIVETEGALCALCGRPCHDPCVRGHRAEHKSLEAMHPYR
jgi:hypothetical protein